MRNAIGKVQVAIVWEDELRIIAAATVLAYRIQKEEEQKEKPDLEKEHAAWCQVLRACLGTFGPEVADPTTVIVLGRREEHIAKVIRGATT